MHHWKTFYVYILTNKLKTVLYIGMTNNLEERIIQPCQQRFQKTCFTGKYSVYFLLWFETHQYVNNAIARENEIKSWRREKKMQFAEMNPELKFLNEEVFGKWPPEELPQRG